MSFIISETNKLILMNLHRNDPNLDFFQNSSKNLIPFKTVVAMATVLKNIKTILRMSLSKTVRPRLTWLIASSNGLIYNSGVKIGPTQGSQVLLGFILSILEVSFCPKPQCLGLPNLACSFIYQTFKTSLQIVALKSKFALPEGSQMLHKFIKWKLLISVCPKSYGLGQPNFAHSYILLQQLIKLQPPETKLTLPQGWGEGVTKFTKAIKFKIFYKCVRYFQVHDTFIYEPSE